MTNILFFEHALLTETGFPKFFINSTLTSLFVLFSIVNFHTPFFSIYASNQYIASLNLSNGIIEICLNI